jgi:hydrogenase nickel incorporation protein HypA/HybF
MHEAGIVRRMLDAAVERAGGARITRVELEVGEASGVSVESVELHWPLVTAGTTADGAALVILEAADPFACRLVAIDVDDGAGSPSGPVQLP